jgi:hypothetical protein
MVPFFKNKDFIGRENALTRLEELLSPTMGDCQQKAALWGLGGIG